MRRALVILFTLLTVVSTIAPAFAADKFPAQKQPMAQPAPQAAMRPHPQAYYGYVPSPPIRHTWPGGYRVIFHELNNTLIEHILGQY